MIDRALLSHQKSQKVLWGKELWPRNSEADKKRVGKKQEEHFQQAFQREHKYNFTSCNI